MAGTLLAAALTLASLHVSVAQEPSIQLMPSNILKPLGEGVYVSCLAKVDDPDLVTEMKWVGPNGLEIPSKDGSGNIVESYEGPGKLALIINSLREQDAGAYNCTAIYAGNKGLAASISVQAFKDIDFGDTPEHQTPLINTEAKIRCTATAMPAPQVDWLKDLVPIKNDENYIIQQDGILIKKVTEEDEGVYRCRVRVPQLGSIKHKDIQVEVYIPPAINIPPEDTEGVEKESVTFKCGATGKPAPKYSWVDKDNRPLNDDDEYYVDDVEGVLTIMHLKPEHTGTYRCTATNEAGDDSKSAELLVLTKPKVEQYLNITVQETATAEMQCISTGDPPPELIFKKETNEENFINGLNHDDRISVEQTTDDQGRSVGILKIRDVNRSDDGLYTCTATSRGGETQVWGHITVEFKPTFEIQQLTEYWSWEQAVVNLTCHATSIPNATIQWYLRNQEIPAEDENLKVMALGPVGVLQVNPGNPSYYGMYTCEATNYIGKSKLDIELKEAHVPGPISNSKVEKKTATTITWILTDPTDNGGLPIQGYLVQYRPIDFSWDDAQQYYWTKGSSYVVEGLTPQSTYVFRFRARSQAGDGEWGGEKSEEMPKHAEPEEPLIFNVQAGVTEIPYSNYYTLQWQVPLDNGKEINYFQIMYYQVKNSSGTWEPIDTKTTQEVEHPGDTSYKIENLRSNSYYRIELRAHNDIGFSTPAEAVIKTAQGPTPGATTEDDGSLGIGIIIAIVVIAVLVIAVVVDVTCFFTKHVGVTAAIAGKRGSNDKDKEAMLEDGKNASDDKHEGNGHMKTEKKDDIKQEQKDSEEKTKENTEPSETTPMIQGEKDDKEAILKEEQKEKEDENIKKSESKSSVTKDSPV